MRKRIIGQIQQEIEPPDHGWLNIEELAEVEITSEDAAHPIEAALRAGDGSGWCAAASGEQTIRILFDSPQSLRRIWLLFVEPHTKRTQEYVLRWSGDGGRVFQEIVRQQWNFSPEGANREVEDHHVQLPAVTTLELRIIPDISGGDAIASLAQLRLA